VAADEISVTEDGIGEGTTSVVPQMAKRPQGFLAAYFCLPAIYFVRPNGKGGHPDSLLRDRVLSATGQIQREPFAQPATGEGIPRGGW